MAKIKNTTELTIYGKIQLAIKRGYTYNPETGIVIRNQDKISFDKNGYLRINLSYNNKNCPLTAHQFAYFMVYNKIPEYIDHIDQNKQNNKIDNLRAVTNQQNMLNVKNRKGYFKSGNKFHSQIYQKYKIQYLGLYKTEAEASAVYQQKRAELNKEIFKEKPKFKKHNNELFNKNYQNPTGQLALDF